jgi:hypothetical protein
MKKALLITALCFIVLCFPIIYLACTSDSVSASTGEQFILPIGKTAVIAKENLSVKFEELTADSRCPTGAQCIQAGNAICNVVFTYKDQKYPVTLETGVTQDNSVTFTDYKVKFNLIPYPSVGKEIPKKDYKLTIMITKK